MVVAAGASCDPVATGTDASAPQRRRVAGRSSPRLSVVNIPPRSYLSPTWHALLAVACLVSGLGTATGVRAQDAPPTDGVPQDWPLDDAPGLATLAARHGLSIGNAMRDGFQTLERAELYRRIVSHEFDITTPESSLKWALLRPTEQRYMYAPLDAIVDFAAREGIDLHGHPLVWHRINPPWLDSVAPERVEAVMTAHIAEVVGRYRGRFQVWDVVNEALEDAGPALRSSVFFDAMGERFIDIAHAAAHEADPGAELIYNDFGVGWPTVKSEGMFALLGRLQARGVPLDGVGFQMHIDHPFAHVEGVSTNLQRAADLGLDVWITEFDVGVQSVDDYDAQATLYEDILKRCLMQPACRAFQIWGLDDFYSFRPFVDPLPFDDRVQPKPAFFAMRRALSSEPVHLESCELEGLRVSRGDIVPVVAAGGQGALSEAAIARCDGVRLGPGYARLSVRYRNAGTLAPSLSVSTAAGEVLARVALEPTAATRNGVHRTVTIDTAVRPIGDTTLVVAVEGDPEGAGVVGIDALLFESPDGPVGVEGAATPSPSRGGGGATGLAWWLIGLPALVLRHWRVTGSGSRFRPARSR